MTTKLIGNFRLGMEHKKTYNGMTINKLYIKGNRKKYEDEADKKFQKVKMEKQE